MLLCDYIYTRGSACLLDVTRWCKYSKPYLHVRFGVMTANKLTPTEKKLAAAYVQVSIAETALRKAREKLESERRTLEYWQEQNEKEVLSAGTWTPLRA